MFCGQLPLTKEHVFPQWLNRYLGPGRIELSQARYGEEAYENSRSAKGLDFQVRTVCAGCNHGWMSDLEQQMMVVLDPFVTGLGRQMITPSIARLLSVWACKTAMVIDRTQLHPVVADAPLRRFKQTRGIPAGTHVWVGACENMDPLVTSLTIRTQIETLADPLAHRPVGLFSPIKVGHLCLYVFLAGANVVAEPYPLDLLSMAEIWPRSRRSVPWPPPANPPTGAEFEEFAEQVFARLEVLDLPVKP